MRILFDQGTPRPLRQHLPEHTIDTAAEKGWSALSNGELLDHAEQEAYQLMITTDQNMRYQQNFGHRWPRIQPRIGEIRSALEAIQPGEIREVLL